ncbi:MAG: hypothetical protein IPG94_08235 [Kineosporiaceae bacterium]|nr:hypothetical protein [Kineosporiaceae bacterium]
MSASRRIVARSAVSSAAKAGSEGGRTGGVASTTARQRSLQVSTDSGSPSSIARRSASVAKAAP